MNFGGSKKSKIQPVKAVIRTVKVAPPKKPTPRPSAVRLAERHRTSSPAGRASPSSAARMSPARDESRLRAPSSSRSKVRKPSPGTEKIDWGDDSNDEDTVDSTTDFEEPSRKKVRLDRTVVDKNRRLRQKEAFSEVDGGRFDMIHAADISTSKTGEENVVVELKYPSASQKERYKLVFGRDKIDPAEEICDIANIITDVYLTEEQAKTFTEPNSGYIRQLEKAKNILGKDKKNRDKLENFKSAVDSYNNAVEGAFRDGAITKTLDSRHSLPLNMIQRILGQVYDRAVSPKVDLLKRYENGTDNVYGELRAPLISEALKKTGLKSDHVFVDLGSGVGNVVLQAALEFGCESWGCEMMQNATKLADAQAIEFKARCRLWGIQAGQVHLEAGDFLENQEIYKAMERADVILVNNQAFTSELNQKLVQMFLDAKDGCKIVSLRSFVPEGYEISHRNIDNPVNLLSVEKYEYHSGSVSWTDASGNYFISTKDVNRVKEWESRSP